MQPSRVGQAAITLFVPAEAMPRIRAALADAGYGTSYQAGVVALLDELLLRQGREPLRSQL
jgi:hypothetical protein